MQHGLGGLPPSHGRAADNAEITVHLDPDVLVADLVAIAKLHIPAAERPVAVGSDVLVVHVVRASWNADSKPRLQLDDRDIV